MLLIKAIISMINVFILFLVVISGILNLCAARFLTRERQVHVFVFISSFYSLIVAAVILCFEIFKILWFHQ
ncbi:hypothetical protein PD_0941 [Xylella fastidiosa Temecula1]|uniref:Uncharacterized protein n=2 Tax=Xylella fastidiosa TaxID=2371 RepID=Q877M9_XYLFT|nr:hypothetical protein [Xylella fastidiosa]AAO28773.1 hypothetical protein PD_0908 [Xylella fastidiosa Temecula1]AAO28806.1 hypothetical protein PD_0941 [Xylella fastidiosa Temecula1]